MAFKMLFRAGALNLGLFSSRLFPLFCLFLSFLYLLGQHVDVSAMLQPVEADPVVIQMEYIRTADEFSSADQLRGDTVYSNMKHATQSADWRTNTCSSCVPAPNTAAGTCCAAHISATSRLAVPPRRKATSGCGADTRRSPSSTSVTMARDRFTPPVALSVLTAVSSPEAAGTGFANGSPMETTGAKRSGPWYVSNPRWITDKMSDDGALKNSSDDAAATPEAYRRTVLKITQG